MKVTKIAVILAALATLGLSSCSRYGDDTRLSAASVGSVYENITCQVVSAQRVEFDASSESKNLATAAGAIAGAAAGQLGGGGSGRWLYTAGGAIVGAAAGRQVASYANTKYGQRLILETTDKSKKRYTVEQQVYKNIGEIAPGTRGTLMRGTRGSRFMPDGAY